MRFLLDTNVISELRKGSRCDPAVASWAHHQLIPLRGAISVITIGEIRKGIDLIVHRDPQQASALETWLQALYQNFANRLIAVSSDVAEEWGRLNAVRPLPAVDSLLAATANVHGLILATRNVNDLKNVGVQVVDPFDFLANP